MVRPGRADRGGGGVVGEQPVAGVDEVRIVGVDDGDSAPVNALLAEGWRLLACGVSEQREVRGAGATSFARCTFILGRARAEQVLAEAAAVVEAVEERIEQVVTIPALETIGAVPGEDAPGR